MKRAGSRSGSGSGSQLYGSADPDPYQDVTDPQHRNLMIVNCIDTHNVGALVHEIPNICYTVFYSIIALYVFVNPLISQLLIWNNKQSHYDRLF